MKNYVKNSPFFPFKLDKRAKELIAAFAFPFIVALDCIFMQVYMKCGRSGNEGGFSFDTYSVYSDLPFLNGYCGNYEYNLYYFWLGVFFYFFLGLSVVLPILLYLRRRPARKTTLFE